MTVVLHMEQCPFCKTEHWTDQKCEGDNEDIQRLYAGMQSKEN